MASNWASNDDGGKAQSEVASSSVNHSKAVSQLAIGIGEGPGVENNPRANSDVGSPLDGYHPVIGDEGITEAPATGPEGEGEGNLTMAAFWRVLADAGYDVW